MKLKFYKVPHIWSYKIARVFTKETKWFVRILQRNSEHWEKSYLQTAILIILKL